MSRPNPFPPLLLALLPVLILGACGGGDGSADPDPGGLDGGDPIPALPRRSDDPRVQQVRAALEFGDVDLAQASIEQAATLAGPVEGPLLRARLSAYLPGGELESVRLIGIARRAGVDDARVAATAAELYAWGSNLPEAEDELRRAGVALGSTETPPELLRAYGIAVLCTPGARPREGLALLEQAVAADPELPFVKRAMGQAHLLISKDLARNGETEQALAAVERALDQDPDDLDTVRMKAELLTALGEWGQALELYEELLAEGLPMEGEAADLYKRAGYFAELRLRRSDRARHYLRRAIELGLPRKSLGEIELRVLREAANDEADKGGQLFSAGDLVACEEHLDEALYLDPGCLLARNLRGDLYAQRGAKGEFELAVLEWQSVITSARLDGIELPEPVHIKLARHQVLGLDDLRGALETLESYLTFEPQGRWAEETAKLLAALPPPPPPEDDAEGDGDGDGDGDGEEEGVEDGGTQESDGDDVP